MIGPTPHLDDLRLRDRVLAGDPAAARHLFEHHLDALFEFVHYRVGGDRAAVEDVVQDVFLVALERLGAFDGRSSLSTWLCGIARNKIRASRRRRRPVPLADVLADADQEIWAILAELEREPLPEQALERRETAELVGATLSSLPPDYRRALVQKYVEGRTTAEIAAESAKSPKATESLLHRARTAFARVFELLARRQGDLE